ncbi:uncharacterized protein IAS62_001970 [Cryptococcus decagattii]|uniref:Cytochrome b5 heme-binding domain-containing protein n=1 Tax=Cryptococcus decagattii TaxID=1859122 RepID=A0ABZ2AU05_9TREE
MPTTPTTPITPITPNIEDVYSNDQDWYPGIRERSKPGQAPHEVIYDKTTDINGNLVTDKPANRAMLANQRRQKEHDAKVQAQQERRAASMGQQAKSSFWTFLPILLFLPLLSSFLTQSYTFNLSPYVLPHLKNFWAETPLNIWRREMKEFTPLQLAMFDGSPDRPVYLAIDGIVYDVTANRRIYGKGGSYNMMAGRDASRAFTTGCFETHLTHDIRGLSTEELASLGHWKSFFAKSDKYFKVGTVINPLINPNSPIPPPCRDDDSASDADVHAPGEAAAKKGKAKPGPVHGQ